MIEYETKKPQFADDRSAIYELAKNTDLAMTTLSAFI
ncbi:hypothetical protein J2T09_003430 [Neorhizobium huautlense]|uniref:Uncharacterized protein n=1 Tax=Neorhizobium huautlense TaxID=67774 RepID=A0ABT9PVY3_9HYPH|nr:hypothetical protein [Neorhizobium huautlense]